jgi:hypothetical protein
MVMYAVELARDATTAIIETRLNELGPTSVAGTPGKPLFSKKEQKQFRQEIAERTEALLRREVFLLFDATYHEVGAALEIPGTVMIPEPGDEEAASAVARSARELFTKFDADDSGDLDRSEVVDLVVRLGKALSEAELTAAMGAMDADGDGRVDIDEFETWWSTDGVQLLAEADVMQASGKKKKSKGKGKKKKEKKGKGEQDLDDEFANPLTLSTDAFEQEGRPGSPTGTPAESPTGSPTSQSLVRQSTMTFDMEGDAQSPMASMDDKEKKKKGKKKKRFLKKGKGNKEADDDFANPLATTTTTFDVEGDGRSPTASMDSQAQAAPQAVEQPGVASVAASTVDDGQSDSV